MTDNVSRRARPRPRAAVSVLAAAVAAGMALGSGDCEAPPPATTVPCRAPVVVRIPVPDTPGSNAIFGAIGRDRSGHLWLGVSSKHIESPSAHLFEYDPATGEMTDRGDVVTAMKQCGVYREGHQQMKIHSRIVQAADGNMYFASMDEEGESVRDEINPTYGGHMWRLKMPQRKWEHLLAAPEALIGVAEAGQQVYALGYWGHVLYQYDCKSGKVRSVRVGEIGGHISRNLLTDRKGHVYVPRVKAGQDGGRAVATLVEFDPSLREVGELPLTHYIETTPEDSQGITGFQKLPDGSSAFITQYGHVALLIPARKGLATITNLGWLHPDGTAYTHSLFTDPTGRYLMGTAKRDRQYEWAIYDIQTRTSKAFPFLVGADNAVPQYQALYGTSVRDDAGRCYVGGGEDGTAMVLQIRP
ncbi:MAG TPA: hypothetical protein VFJ30_12015 [Phycisphaerae bacterium]|nr:hypothetical protein [Phycisphaerae bacterium]